MSATKPAGRAAPDSRPPGMYRAPTQRAEALGVDTVRNIVKGELEWEFYPQELPEWGVDAQVGIVDADELVTGQLIALQIKGGASYFSKENKTGWLFQENNDHLAYWLGQSLPVVLVLVAPDGTAYWEHFNTRTIKENKKGFSLTVPRSQVFNGAARESLLQIAGRCGGLVAALPRNYAVLPSDARRCLERAALVDALAGARLADRLAEKRAKPQYVVSTVLSVPPTWLTLSPAVHDLWLALASFAREHAFDREASQGFLNAAESGGPGAARARALAGLSLMFVDREAAGGHLRVARGGGAVLLADVGLAFLDVPLNDARAVEVPPSMRDASADDLNAEPTVLNFLAEMAQRRGDIETALDYRRRALRYSLDDPSMALALARTLWLRVMKAKSPSLRDEREALQHAQAALQDRRRWAGPSAEALALLLEIHITSHNLAMVLRAALPVSEGGTALESESRQPEIAGHGGAVAHGVGNVHAFEFFKAQLQDGPELHELQAIEREEGLAAPDQVALWENILDEATDDEMVVRCARRLASLGAWSQKLDHMHARSVLPEDIYETLRAVCRACAGELEIGLAKLRDLANNTSQAAMELVLVLESHDVEAAIDECEHQIERWHRPDLRTHLITLHIRHGGEERAAELVEQNIANESFAAEIRLAWCSWYVLYRARRGEFAPAVALAEDGLALGEDANLAWNLVSALVEDGKLSRAREALARYRPMPLSEDECRLWLRLHLGTDVSADDARQMVLLVRDQPPGPVRDMAVTLLVREVILRPEATGRTPYPAELTTEVKEFVELFRHVPGAHIFDANDDEEMRRVLEHEQVDPGEFERLRSQVRKDAASTADIAALVQRPYGTALLQRPGGALFAFDLSSALRGVGEAAAKRAMAERCCVVDLSALHLTNLLDEDDRLLTRGAIGGLVLPRSAVEDAVRTLDDMRTLEIASFTGSLQSDGTLDTEVLSPTQLAFLEEFARALEASVATAEVEKITPSAGAVEDSICLAQERGLSFWCDDSLLRQRARGRRVDSFSTLDILSVLHAAGTIDPRRAYLALAVQWALDLPLDAADISTLAADLDWDQGPAHAQLSRRGWWRWQAEIWQDTWYRLASEAGRWGADALVRATIAALTGSIDAAPTALGTQRYQEVVVLALAANQNAPSAVPTDFLDQLAARAADPRLPPRPPFVLHALSEFFATKGAPEPLSLAMSLLPGVAPLRAD